MNIIRGDEKGFRFQRKSKNDGEIITTTPNEIYFTVKSNYYDTDVLIQKTLSNGDIQYNESDKYYRFRIKPEDTNNLYYGDYVYDLEIKNKDNKPKTIARGNFTIDWEVTFSENE